MRIKITYFSIILLIITNLSAQPIFDEYGVQIGGSMEYPGGWGFPYGVPGQPNWNIPYTDDIPPFNADHRIDADDDFYYTKIVKSENYLWALYGRATGVGQPFHIMLHKSEDNGETWPGDGTIAVTQYGQIYPHTFVVSEDEQKVAIAYSRADTVYFVRSIDGGQSFEQPVQMSANDFWEPDADNPTVFSIGDTLFYAFDEGEQYEKNMKLNRSRNWGSIWLDEPIVVDSNNEKKLDKVLRFLKIDRNILIFSSAAKICFSIPLSSSPPLNFIISSLINCF